MALGVAAAARALACDTWLETVRSERFGDFWKDKQVAVCCLAPNFLVTTDTKLNVERMPGYPKAFWESGLQTMNKCLAMWVTQALPQI